MSELPTFNDESEHAYIPQRHSHDFYLTQQNYSQQQHISHHPQHLQHHISLPYTDPSSSVSVPSTLSPSFSATNTMHAMISARVSDHQPFPQDLYQQNQHQKQHQQQQQVYPPATYNQPLMIMLPPQPIPNYIIPPQQCYTSPPPTHSNWDASSPVQQSVPQRHSQQTAAGAAAAAALAAATAVSSANSSFDSNDASMNKKYQCHICHKYYRRDLPRHLRTHQLTARFQCPYPRAQCSHKRGQFNRPYDYKKHLLHCHFTFDEQKLVRGFRDLRSKLGYWGVCSCGKRFLAEEWLAKHIIVGPGDPDRCSLLDLENEMESCHIIE